MLHVTNASGYVAVVTAVTTISTRATRFFTPGRCLPSSCTPPSVRTSSLTLACKYMLTNTVASAKHRHAQPSAHQSTGVCPSSWYAHVMAGQQCGSSVACLWCLTCCVITMKSEGMYCYNKCHWLKNVRSRLNSTLLHTVVFAAANNAWFELVFVFCSKIDF